MDKWLKYWGLPLLKLAVWMWTNMLNNILLKINPDDHIMNISAGVHEGASGPSDRAWQGPIRQKLFGPTVCTAFQRLFQSPVTRSGLRLIRNGGHSPRVFQTLHNLPDTVSWAITVLSLAPRKHSEKKRRTYRSTFCGTLPPPAPIFHASISQILLCNKAEIKRLAAQLKYNERGGEPLTSGVAGLQRMRYLDTTWGGFIRQGLPCEFLYQEMQNEV